MNYEAALRDLFQNYPDWVYTSVMVLLVLLLSGIVYLVTRRYLLRFLSRLAAKSKTEIDDAILDKVIYRRLAYVAPILVIYAFLNLTPDLEIYLKPLLLALMALIVLLSAGAFLNQIGGFLQDRPLFRGKPIKSYVQVVKLIIYLMGAILVIGLLTNSSPLALLSGLGAMTAVLLFIFRDTILSFIASIQITANDLVRVGDWIEVRKYGADGDVIDIALHVVKIQNWDKTISVIPTHKLIDETFINWRGMQQSGGRRIKRAIHIDINTIRFCDAAMLAHFRKIQLIADYVTQRQAEVEEDNRRRQIDESVPANGRRLTNIGNFRKYVEAYLRQHDRINQQLTFLVRQLPPGNTGLPIEVYVFTNDTVWANYEVIQADVFDHFLAVLPEFGLRAFQDPTGQDFRMWGKEKTAGT